MKVIKSLSFFLLLASFASCNLLTREAALKKNEEALAKLNQGNHEEAILLFKEALKTPFLKKAERGTVFRNISLAFSAMEQSDSMLYYVERAADCFPEGSYGHLINTADANLIKGRVKTAIGELEEAYEKEPGGLEVNNLLGVIYMGFYDYDYYDPEKALRYNQKAFELARDHSTQEVLARNYHMLGKYEMAESHYTKLVANYPQFTYNYVGLGYAIYELGREEEAEAHFNTALAADSSLYEDIYYFKTGYYPDEYEITDEEAYY